MSTPRIALTYDRVNTLHGGAENVLLALHDIFPDAPLYTSVYNPETAPWAKVFTVIPSFLQHIPFAKNRHRLFAVLMPLAFESFDLSAFDIVISITSAEAKGVLTKPNQLHVCYLLTPTRYLWSHTQEYEQDPFSGWLRKKVFQYLRWWDTAAALRPDFYIPISRLVAERCERYYHRPTEAVIYPTVAQQHSAPAKISLPFKEYYLIVSRLVPYKRIDLAIQACQKLGRNLIIIGQGPDQSRLEEIAKSGGSTSRTIFLQAVQTDEVIAYYTSCRAFLAPAEEDFGMTVLEAQVAGKPVIVYQKSGSAEVMKENETGVLFSEQTEASLSAAMQKSEKIPWNSSTISQFANVYTKEKFQLQFRQKIEELWKGREKHE